MKRRLIWVAMAIVSALMAVMPNPVPLRAETQPTCQPGDQVWIGSFGYGVNCLDGTGWHSYNAASGAIADDLITAVAYCNGKVWIADSLGITITDGSQWDKMDSSFIGINAIACKGTNVYIAHENELSHWAGSSWEAMEGNKFASQTVTEVKDVTIGPDGKVWVVTPHSVAAGDGKTWTIFEKGKGFDEAVDLSKIAIDSKGNIWVSGQSKLYEYDGQTWNKLSTDSNGKFDTLAIGPSDTIYGGSHDAGIAVYNGKLWIYYAHSNSKMSSDGVNSFAVDGQGRLWVGTEYGLDVFDGKTFTPYLMANSGLVDNKIMFVVAVGKGPALPAPLTRETGSLSGTVITGTTPLGDAVVEVCTQFVGTFAIGNMYVGKTPCSNDPFFKDGTTGADGKFTIGNLPPGRYGIVIQKAEGNWWVLTDQFSEQRFEVKEGADHDLGVIDLSKAK